MVEPRLTGEPKRTPVSGSAPIASDLPIGREDLAELARWVPAKEIALLIEICDRADREDSREDESAELHLRNATTRCDGSAFAWASARECHPRARGERVATMP